MTGTLVIAGHASLFRIPDQRDDVVMPGAFTRSLARPGQRVRMLWQHDPRAVIGIWDLLQEDARGLYVRGRVATGTAGGRAVAALLARGGGAGLSIGFRIIRAGRDGATRILHEVALEEISITPEPMHPQARASLWITPDDNIHPEEAIVPEQMTKTVFTAHHPEHPSGTGLETKAMSSSTGGDGGFLVMPDASESIAAVLTSTSSLRDIASVAICEGGAYDMIIDAGEWDSAWGTESGARSETNTGSLKKVTIGLHELYALPRASTRLIEDVTREGRDIATFVTERVSAAFARMEAAAFVTGDGMNKPRGFLDYAKAANASWTWGGLGFIASGSASTIPDTDPLVDLVQALPQGYRDNATWVMNSKTAGVLYKLDASLWDGLERFFGYPVLVLEDMPDIGANAFPVAFGDFRRGYRVVEKPGLRVTRDPYTERPHVVFNVTRRVGGSVTDFAAIKLLKVAV